MCALDGRGRLAAAAAAAAVAVMVEEQEEQKKRKEEKRRRRRTNNSIMFSLQTWIFWFCKVRATQRQQHQHQQRMIDDFGRHLLRELRVLIRKNLPTSTGAQVGCLSLGFALRAAGGQSGTISTGRANARAVSSERLLKGAPRYKIYIRAALESGGRDDAGGGGNAGAAAK